MASLRIILLVILTILCTACATVSPCTGNTSMTDADITTSVQVQLAHDTGLADLDITVSTFERVVTLTGNVQNPTQASIAVVLARSVPGVCCVICKLKVVPIRED